MKAAPSSSELSTCAVCGAAAPAQPAVIGWEPAPEAWLRALALVRAAAARANARCGAVPAALADRIAGAALQAAEAPWPGAAPPLWSDGAGLAIAAAVDRRIVALAGAADADAAVQRNQCADAVATAARLAVLQTCEPAVPRFLERLADVLSGWAADPGRPPAVRELASGWAEQARKGCGRAQDALSGLCDVPLGSGCTGSGYGVPPGFAREAVETLATLARRPLRLAPAPVEALAAHDPLAFAQGTLASLAASLLKIAGDLQQLAGSGAVILPDAAVTVCASLPGQRIPAALEAARSACLQVMGLQTATGFAASEGQFELNAFLPLITDAVLRSIALTTGAADLIGVSLGGERTSRA